MKKIILAAIAAAFFSFAMLVSCSGEDASSSNGGSSEVATSVQLSKISLHLRIGEEFLLESTVYPSSETDMPVTWESTNPNVATCEGGLVKANAVGVAIVRARTATSGYATCTVTVSENPLTSEELSELVDIEFPEFPLWVNCVDEKTGGRAILKIIDKLVLMEESTDPITGTGIAKIVVKFITEKVYDSNSVQGRNPVFFSARLTTGENSSVGAFDFSLSDEKAIRVNEGTDAARTMTVGADEFGMVFGATDHRGGRTFKIEIIGKSDSDVTDYDPSPVSVSLSHKSMNIEEGESFTLEAVVTPEDKEIVWESSDPAVAVYENGVVKGYKAGVAVITARCGETYAECTVTVEERKSEVSISLSHKSIYVELGKSATVTATVTPEVSAVAWESTNPAVATCEGGVISGLSVGSAMIIARVGSTIEYCSVTVVDLATRAAVELPDFPIELDYVDPATGVKTSFIITGATVTRALRYSETDGNYIYLEVKFHVEKTYDDGGEEGLGLVAFNVVVTESGAEHQTILVGETNRVVGDSFDIEYVCGIKFEEGRRNITVTPVAAEN